LNAKGDQATAGGDEERPAERPEPGQVAALGWAGVAQILGGVAGVAVLVGGAAFLIGWIYTRTFYERLGIPTRALDLGPTDYATAKVDIWYAFALAALAGAAAVAAAGAFGPIVVRDLLRTGWGARCVEWCRSRDWRMAEVTAGALVFLTGWLGISYTGNSIFFFPFTLGGAFATLALWVHARALRPHWPRTALTWLAAFFALGTALVALWGGTILGRHDAEDLLAGPGEGSGARFVAAEPLGLPGERYEPGVYVIEAGVYLTETGA
jgi:hypothetical protein